MVTKGRGFNLGERKYVLTFFQNKKTFTFTFQESTVFTFTLLVLKR